jgi:putative ABC transport system permease protein
MQQHIGPIAIINVNFATQYRYLSFRLKPGDMQNSILALQKQWSALMPDAPI